MFGVELARLYASVTSVMPSTAASAETRMKPVRRESSVPAPTTMLERASDRVLGPAWVLVPRRSRREGGGAGRTAAAAPVHEPPHGEEQARAHREEHTDTAHERRADRVARGLEGEAAVGRAHGHDHREGPRRPGLHRELGRGVSRG